MMRLTPVLTYPPSPSLLNFNVLWSIDASESSILDVQRFPLLPMIPMK
jgi:hypothetical protein